MPDKTVVFTMRISKPLMLQIKALRMTFLIQPTQTDIVRYCIMRGLQTILAEKPHRPTRVNPKKPLLQDAATVARDLRRLARRRFGKAAAVVS